MEMPLPHQVRLLNNTTEDHVAGLAKYLRSHKRQGLKLENTDDIQRGLRRLEERESLLYSRNFKGREERRDFCV